MRAGPAPGEPAPAGALALWAAGLCPAPARLAVAVSGGGDSLALLHLLHERGGFALSVYTVDHGLRPEAAAEAQAVAAASAALGLPHRTLPWRWDGRGNLSEAARRGRYAALAAACTADGIADCALAHTRSDNVESLVLGLMRGAGLDGLCGMRAGFAVAGVTFHRPLLAVPRDSLRAELRARGIAWAEDPTNADEHYDRARIRSALAALGLPEAQLARSVANLAATRRDLNAELWARIGGEVRAEGPDLAVGYDSFAALTPEFRRRLLSAALVEMGRAAHPPRAGALLRLVHRDWKVAPGPATLHGCTVALRRGALRIGREPGAVPPPAPPRDGWDGWRFEGPGDDGKVIRALGEDGLRQLAPGWRAAGLARRSLLAAPSVWEGERLLAFPFWPPAEGGEGGGWRCLPAHRKAGLEAALLSG